MSTIQNPSPIVAADTAWVLTSTALVLIMLPGVGYYYGGNSRNKDKLSVLMSSLLAGAIVTIEWFLWGYTLSLSNTGGVFIGDFKNIVLSGVGNEPNADLAPTIPHNCYMIYQNMFASVTAALVFGAVTERASLRGYVVFLFFWSVFVYDIVAYWTWSKNGWLRNLGSLDFAGGTVVHIVSGMSGLAYALVVGPRIGFKQKEFNPVNLSDVFIGTALLWFGWFGFNAGSELAINSRSVNALVITNLSASMGGLCWLIMDMILKRSRKISISGFCNGAIAGLVAITPASGYVSPPSSLVFGALAGFFCCASTRIKKLKFIPIDDACDVFAVHAVGGIVGGLLTGIFADNNVIAMAGGVPTGKGGWINGNYIQLLWQLVGVSAAAGWAFFVSLILAKILDFIPFLNLRLSAEQEERGSDLSELTEKSFGIDLSELNENFLTFQRNLSKFNQQIVGSSPMNIQDHESSPSKIANQHPLTKATGLLKAPKPLYQVPFHVFRPNMHHANTAYN